ncbi:MAG: DinB family protein [Anaerolineales bacterium]|nr:DinB family protein [Anaerolineales bacterium]MCB9144236.1 DinB family protein [Anaerolineales bacterium]
MKELYEYREKILERLPVAVSEFCEECRSFADPLAEVEEGWNVHQIAFHVRGVNREVYGVRILRTLNENNPLFKNFDPDGWMAEHYDSNEDMEKIVGEFQAEMNDLCSVLLQVPHEAWSRMGTHESLGPDLTLQLWVERSLAHLEEHLAVLRNIKK